MGILTVHFKDESITIDIVPQLKNFHEFSWVVTPFCKSKVRKTRLKLELLLL